MSNHPEAEAAIKRFAPEVAKVALQQIVTDSATITSTADFDFSQCRSVGLEIDGETHVVQVRMTVCARVKRPAL